MRALPVRTEAVLLHKNSPSPNRRSTRPGCDICPPHSHRGGAPTQKQPLLPTVGAPAPGAIHARPVRTGAVLLHKNSPSSQPEEHPPRVRICAEAVMPEVLRL